MKKAAIVIVLFLCSIIYSYGQIRVSPNKPYLQLNSRSGYITVNELSFGFGLFGKTSPYSDLFYGLTSVHGYQFDRNLIIGGGVGLAQYGDGVLFPLFLDLRYNYYLGTITFYLFGDAGFLINPTDINAGTMMFINAGPGLRRTLSPQFAVNISPALLIQMGPTSRASFINIKLGATYKSR